MASENKYFDQPILFAGDIDFSRNFESLLISYGQSKSVNLIWTVQNFIKKGEEMGLSNQGWIQFFVVVAGSKILATNFHISLKA